MLHQHLPSTQHSRSRDKEGGGFPRRAADWDETGLHWVSADQDPHLREPPHPVWRPYSLQPQPWHPPSSQGNQLQQETREGMREKVFPTESQQILGGKQRTIPGPQHIRKQVTGNGAETRERIHLGLRINWYLQTRGPLSWLLTPLLHSGHLVGTGEASRQSFLQSPVLADRATSKAEPGGWGRGARERQADARLSLIWLHAVTQPCGTLCASQTNRLSLCSAAPVLSHRQASHTPSHTHSHTHTLTHPTHTHSHTLTQTHPYTLLTHPHIH